MGITLPTSGDVQIFGRPLRGEDPGIRRRIGYVAQEQAFYGWMTPLGLGRFVVGLLSQLAGRRVPAAAGVAGDPGRPAHPDVLRRHPRQAGAGGGPGPPPRAAGAGRTDRGHGRRRPAGVPGAGAPAGPAHRAHHAVLVAPHRRGGAGGGHRGHHRRRPVAVAGAGRDAAGAVPAAGAGCGRHRRRRGGTAGLPDCRGCCCWKIARKAAGGRCWCARPIPAVLEALAAAAPAGSCPSPRSRTCSSRWCAGPWRTDRMAATRALIGKELRQHAGALMGLSMLLALCWLLAALIFHQQARTLSVLQLVPRFAMLPLGAAALYLGHRLVVAENYGRTQRFVEALPVHRGPPAAGEGRFRAGCSCWLWAGAALAAGLVLSRADGEPVGGRFVAILAARLGLFVFALWGVVFLLGWFGRLRLLLGLGLVVAVVLLDRQTSWQMQEFGPFALVADDRFAFERDHFPVRALLETAVLGAGLLRRRLVAGAGARGVGGRDAGPTAVGPGAERAGAGGRGGGAGVHRAGRRYARPRRMPSPPTRCGGPRATPCWRSPTWRTSCSRRRPSWGRRWRRPCGRSARRWAGPARGPRCGWCTGPRCVPPAPGRCRPTPSWGPRCG